MWKELLCDVNDVVLNLNLTLTSNFIIQSTLLQD
jgi:hypothetical protein